MEARVEGDTRTEYSYSYDRLTAIERYENDILTETITLTYDEAGNIINDGEYSYSWEMGRQLAGITSTELDISFEFNQNGLRTSKAVTTATGTTSHYYTYLGSSVTRERIVNQDQQVITIHYSYAGGHSPVSMSVDGTEYHYLKNAQGDITHIVDSSGNIVVEYEYDAWGNILSVTGDQELGRLNPYRYRGYRYDEEAGLYYLQSRYYNPEWGRFINADVLLGPGILANMYAYCGNNPVSREDSSGYLWDVIREFVANLSIGFSNAKYAFAAAGASAAIDGPLPFGDIIGACILGVALYGVVEYAITNTFNSPASQTVRFARRISSPDEGTRYRTQNVAQQRNHVRNQLPHQRNRPPRQVDESIVYVLTYSTLKYLEIQQMGGAHSTFIDYLAFPLALLSVAKSSSTHPSGGHGQGYLYHELAR